MKEQERITFQALERKSHNISRAEQPGIRVSDSYLEQSAAAPDLVDNQRPRVLGVTQWMNRRRNPQAIAHHAIRAVLSDCLTARPLSIAQLPNGINSLRIAGSVRRVDSVRGEDLL